LDSVMAARASTGIPGRYEYCNTAESRYADIDLASVVAALEALDLAAAPREAVLALLAACSATEGRIAVRLATAPDPPAPAHVGPETCISVKGAAARIGVAPKWLYRRKKTLPFMREMVPGTWRVSVPALERWMAARRPARSH
jgi:hypothetical protein